MVTFKNAKKLKQVVQEIPLESIVLETDCPYLAPVPYRGKRNSSLYLPVCGGRDRGPKRRSSRRRRVTDGGKTHGSYTDFREKLILEKRKGAGEKPKNDKPHGTSEKTDLGRKRMKESNAWQSAEYDCGASKI